jgi:hypothetical protein
MPGADEALPSIYIGSARKGTTRTVSSPTPNPLHSLVHHHTAETEMDGDDSPVARHPFNRKMISQKKPGAVFAALQIALVNLNLSFTQGDSQHCLVIVKDTLTFEADVVKISRLNMYGVHFRRVRGPPQQYKDVCTEIISVLRL